ncbi:MAG: winged helix-turn-helix domain-containing protein [Candidatus Hadarchaeia archaeon]
MEVDREIRWLRDRGNRVDLFALISKRGPIKIRDIKEYLGFEDWWPVKEYIDELMDRDLIRRVDEGFKLTEEGEKVFESLKAVHDLESV